MSNQLLKTKLYIPPIRSGVVSRTRLINKLTNGIHQKHRLLLISAPAGFGKTTLASDWVSKVGFPAAWLTLDPGDNEPLRFLSYVIASLNQVNKSIGRGLLELVPGSQVPSIDSILMELINQIASTSGICLLVLDDYQVIEEPEIHRIVEYLIEHMPPQLHLILITRGVPLLPIARMRGRGQLTELRQEDLRFSRQEVTDFLNKVMNLNLSDDDIRELAHRTEGWIAGLLMTALVLQDEVSQNQGGRRREFIKSIDERNRYILDYLLQEVFQRQPRAIQLFLLYTSILDRMCSSLCDAITVDMLEDYQTNIPKIFPSERLNSQQILEYLDQSNLFIVPLDRQKEWYRYHRLFADVLRSRLLREQPDVISLLNERACHWYEKNGYMDLAITHALEGDDFQRAATLIEGIAVHILSRGEMNTLLKWLSLIPDHVMNDHPLLLIYHSWILFIRGQPIDIIESRLGQAQLSDPNKLIAGELLMFNGILAGVRGDIEKSIELSRSALSIIDEGNYFFKGVTIRNLASSYEDAGDLPAAISTLDQSVTMDIRVGNIIGAVVGLSRLAGLRKVQGRLREAEDLYKKALQIVDVVEGKPLPVAGRAMIGLGELYREWNQLDLANTTICEGVDLVERWSKSWAIEGYTGKALVMQSAGNPRQALRAIHKAEELAAAYDASEMDDLGVKLTELRIYLMQGRLDSVELWFQEHGLIEKVDQLPVPYSLLETEKILLAEYLVLKNELDTAIQIINALQESAQKLGRFGSLIKILIIKSLAFYKSGDCDQAIQSIQKSLDLAVSENYRRVFLDEGQPMLRILYEAIAGGGVNPYTSKLIMDFELLNNTKIFHPSDSTSGITDQELFIEPLSDREREVLILIARGLSNREISQNLYISLRTVKWHTGNIYQKLGVKNRTQAVNKARILGIL